MKPKVFVYLLETIPELEKIVSMLKQTGANAVVLKPEFSIALKPINYAYFLAYKSFSQNTAVAREFGLEWISKLACTKNIGKALAFCLPKQKIVLLASGFPLEKEFLKKIGKQLKPSKAVNQVYRSKLTELYALGEKELVNYSLEDLIAEKIALNNIE